MIPTTPPNPATVTPYFLSLTRDALRDWTDTLEPGDPDAASLCAVCLYWPDASPFSDPEGIALIVGSESLPDAYTHYHLVDTVEPDITGLDLRELAAAVQDYVACMIHEAHHDPAHREAMAVQ